MVESKVVHLVPQEKRCGNCKSIKPFSEFTRNKLTKDGLSWNCKPCKNDHRRAPAADRAAAREAAWAAQTHKTCSRCKVEKPVQQFSFNAGRKNGLTPDCKPCRNARYKDPRKNRKDRIPAKYGITYEHAVMTLSSQHGLCANRGCGIPITFEGGMRPDRAVIDHDHKTGKFRAVLCMNCNLTLGKIENEPNKALGLMEYLAKHTAEAKEPQIQH